MKSLLLLIRKVLHRETAEEMKVRIRADLEMMARRGQINHRGWQANSLIGHHDRFDIA